MARLVVPKEIKALIQKMHPELKRKVRAALEKILADPHSGKELKDELSGIRSFRLNSFRIIYRIEDQDNIGLVAIGPRAGIYEETLRILRKRAE